MVSGQARWAERSLAAATSVLPEIAKPLRSQFGISYRVLDVFVAEVVLQRPGIHPLVGQLESGRMPQHVRMDAERHPGGLPKPGQHPPKGNGSHRGTALTHEDISPSLLLSLETAQRAKLGAGQRVDGGHAVLQSMNVQPAMAQIDLLPS